ncbi:MAG: hypothetical protein CMI95_05565 [Pelagibacteraceae bacterium]|nr:hypothetical protein [Pelagibacteraceae bacterium]|tara:strand:+ start:204 stop:452 length:249 start_codon:yes stop_codon:yes gene_type:complete
MAHPLAQIFATMATMGPTPAINVFAAVGHQLHNLDNTQELQDEWQICATKNNLNHEYMIAHCQYTCGIAPGDIYDSIPTLIR